MNIKSLVALIAAGTIAIGMVGCKKEEPKTTTLPVTQETKSTVDKTADAVKEVAATVTNKADSIIEQAKSLVGAGKFQDALSALEGLSGMTLSDVQQKVVDGLMAQIQKALADKAAAQGAGAVGNLLGK